MLDMLRYLVVWVPVILTALHFVFHLMGIEDEEGQDQDGLAAFGLVAANTTGAGPQNLTAGNLTAQA